MHHVHKRYQVPSYLNQNSNTSSEDLDKHRKYALSIFFADYISKHELLADNATEITQAHIKSSTQKRTKF